MRRILVVSSTYVDPANRGKLRALAARDLDVTVGVPQRWREAGLGRALEAGWGRQGGGRAFPIPATGSRQAHRLRYPGPAPAALLRDKRPRLGPAEEEPGARVPLPAGRRGRPLAAGSGGRRAGPRAARGPGERAAARGAGALGRRAAARAARAAVAGPGRAGGAVAPLRHVGRGGPARGGGSDGARGRRDRHGGGRHARDHRRSRRDRAAGRGERAGGRAAPARDAGRAPAAGAGGAGTGDATVLGGRGGGTDAGLLEERALVNQERP